MKAARLHRYNESLQLDEIDFPKPTGESVVVKVGAAGVCHSDIHFMHGEWKDALPVKLPQPLDMKRQGTLKRLAILYEVWQRVTSLPYLEDGGVEFVRHVREETNSYVYLQTGQDFHSMTEDMQNTYMFRHIGFL